MKFLTDHAEAIMAGCLTLVASGTGLIWGYLIGRYDK